MKVEAYPIHSGPRGDAAVGRSNGAPIGASSSATPLQTTEPVDTVTLSDAAQTAISAEAVRGKSANSPAHQARALLAAFEEAGGAAGEINFGQLVSLLARGQDTSDLLAPPENGEPVDVDNTPEPEPLAAALDVNGAPLLPEAATEDSTDIVEILRQAAESS